MIRTWLMLIQSPSDPVLDIDQNSFLGVFDGVTTPGACFQETTVIILRTILIIILTFVIIAAIVRIGVMGIRYPSSGGDEGKLGEANSATGRIFMGLIGGLTVAIIALFALNSIVGQLPGC